MALCSTYALICKPGEAVCAQLCNRPGRAHICRVCILAGPVHRIFRLVARCCCIGLLRIFTSPAERTSAGSAQCGMQRTYLPSTCIMAARSCKRLLHRPFANQYLQVTVHHTFTSIAPCASLCAQCDAFWGPVQRCAQHAVPRAAYLQGFAHCSPLALHSIQQGLLNSCQLLAA